MAAVDEGFAEEISDHESDYGSIPELESVPGSIETDEGNGEEVDSATGHMVIGKGEAEIDKKNNNTSLIGLTVIAGIVFTFITICMCYFLFPILSLSF